MPTYFYRCSSPECNELREDDASMSSFKEHHPHCELCGAQCNYEFVATVPQVAFKDGPSGSWVSKGLRYQKHRQEQHRKAGERQKERYGHLSTEALPNYNGKETGTWAEAQNQALKDKGKESAATYASKVKAEKAKSGA